MKKSIVLFCCLLMIHVANAQSVSKQSRPNIILFLVDDMGWMDTSQPFGDSVMSLNRKYHTPNMERLAKQGMLFSDAYVNPVCTPTRTSLITGASAARTHITNWTSPKGDEATDYADEVLQAPNWNINGVSPVQAVNSYYVSKPLPELLRQAGYRTLFVGKAHFGSNGTLGSNPLNLGFDNNIAGSSIGHPQSYYGKMNFGNQPGKATFNAVPDLYEFYGHDIFLTEALTIKAEQLMDNAIREQSPFFLYMAHYAVHMPIQPDSRFVNRYYAQGLDSTEAAYASLIEGMDKSLGDIMDYLVKKKIDKNTIIIFMSDNGGLANAGRGGIRNTQNLPLRAGKGSMYEGGIRVPLIVKWDGVTKPGSRTKQYVMAEDFYPTVLQMAGIKVDDKNNDLDGKSYVPVLKDAGFNNKNRSLVFHYPNRWTRNEDEAISWASAIRKGDWKLVYKMKEKKLELYNISKDISETQELSASQPAMLKSLATELSNELKRRHAQMPVWKADNQPVAYPDQILMAE